MDITIPDNRLGGIGSDEKTFKSLFAPLAWLVGCAWLHGRRQKRGKANGITSVFRSPAEADQPWHMPMTFLLRPCSRNFQSSAFRSPVFLRSSICIHFSYSHAASSSNRGACLYPSLSESRIAFEITARCCDCYRISTAEICPQGTRLVHHSRAYDEIPPYALQALHMRRES